MNKYFSILLCFLYTSSYASITTEQFPFNGTTVIIIGQFGTLNVSEGEIGEIDIKFRETEIVSESYRVVNKGQHTTIELLDKTIYNISVPSATNVHCMPKEVADQEAWYLNQNNYQISLNKLKGEVIVDTDGYDIQLIDISGPISVVTYGDIEAIFNTEIMSEIISLDTYQGNITVQIPDTLKAKLVTISQKGSIVLNDQLVELIDPTIGNVSSAEIKLIDQDCTMKLHSESGGVVQIQSIKDPTHPELRDKLIKLFIRDQGKKGMSTGARAALNELGYQEYIDSQPEIRPFNGNKLADELVSLIDQYGFPTPEMVGDGYAMKAVAIVLFNSSPRYMDKYQAEYIKYFGQQMLDIYYKRYGSPETRNGIEAPMNPEAPLSPKTPTSPQSPTAPLQPATPTSPKKKGN